jgi:hypothetical protein
MAGFWPIAANRQTAVTGTKIVGERERLNSIVQNRKSRRVTDAADLIP